MDQNKILVLGTRGSMLARAQTQWVVDCLHQAHPDLNILTRIISTKGDQQQDRPLPEIGGKGLFTEELERALRDGEIDLAVHSAKDLPTRLGKGLAVLAWPVREDPRDAWIAADGRPFEELPEQAIVGTTSLRRQAQLLMMRPDLRFIGLRGNVDTRIRKVHRGDCNGAVLAMSGLIRAHLTEHVTHLFEPRIMLPSPGQGALALEGRQGDDGTSQWLQVVQHGPTAVAVRCERAVLAELDAGCRAPVAVLARARGDVLKCRALVADPLGRQHLRAEGQSPTSELDQLVGGIIQQLRQGGADEIIAACRRA